MKQLFEEVVQNIGQLMLQVFKEIRGMFREKKEDEN